MQKKIVIIASVTFILIFIILSIGFLYFSIKRDAPKRTVEEIKICFNQNRDRFEKSVIAINKYPGIINICKRDFTGKVENHFYFRAKDNFYIESKVKLDDKSIQDIKDSTDFILNSLNFEKVFIEDGDVYFIEGSDFAIASGVVYVQFGEKPGDIYLVQLEKIIDKWFYFKMK